MLDLVSFGNKKSYDEFKTQIPVIIQPKFDELRQFCLELGEKLVEDVISDLGASSMQQMGQVMGVLKPKCQGKADMGLLSKLVKTKLSA